MTDPMIENARVAMACGVDPAMALVVAMASSGATTAAEAFARLDGRRAELEAVLAAPPPPLTLTPLEPELRYDPELAEMRLSEGDHEIRGRRLFGELLGRWSFLRVAAWEIAGVELSEADARHLDDQGVLTQIADVRIWPLAVTRRVAASGAGLGPAIVAGLTTLMNPKMAVQPVSSFARFLARLEAEVAAGRTVDEVLRALRAAGERLPGIGRPVVGYDERVAQQRRLLRAYGRADGASVRLADEVDAWFQARHGLALNSAGLMAALLRDLGFTPDASEAFCLLYFLVPTAAHAVYAAERGHLAGG